MFWFVDPLLFKSFGLELIAVQAKAAFYWPKCGRIIYLLPSGWITKFGAIGRLPKRFEQASKAAGQGSR